MLVNASYHYHHNMIYGWGSQNNLKWYSDRGRSNPRETCSTRQLIHLKMTISNICHLQVNSSIIFKITIDYNN